MKPFGGFREASRAGPWHPAPVMTFRLPHLAALFAVLLLACGDGPGANPPASDASDAAQADIAPQPDADASPDGVGHEDAAPPDAIAPPVRNPRALRVATWNVKRLFDTTCDTGKCGGWNDYEELPSADEFAAKVGDVADRIDDFAADIVILQEIESDAALDAVVAALDPQGDTWKTSHLGEIGPDYATVDVAILARFPYIGAYHHRAKTPLLLADGTEEKFAREFLEVHLNVPDADGALPERVVVFAAHFKSKANDQPQLRLAEAKAAHDIVAARAAATPDALIILGGDLNDVPGSAPLTALEGSGALSRVAADVHADYRWTFNFNGKQQAIDHLFLATGASGQYVPGSAHARRDHPNGLGLSDHAALLADFLF